MSPNPRLPGSSKPRTSGHRGKAVWRREKADICEPGKGLRRNHACQHLGPGLLVSITDLRENAFVYLSHSDYGALFGSLSKLTQAGVTQPSYVTATYGVAFSWCFLESECCQVELTLTCVT